MKNSVLARLSMDFQRANSETRSGNVWLSSLAVLALTVSTWMALIVVGGVAMFYRRVENEPPLPADATIEQILSHGNSENYLGMAFVACAFVVPAMIALIAQSAVLGASGREKRLATLRLIGMSNGDIARMTMMETAIQAVIGIVFGTVLSIGTAPFWALVSFERVPLQTWDMVLPWWAYPLVWAAVMLLALGASVLGLKRVMVTPLGVSRRQMPKALRWWRLLLFTVVLVLGIVMLTQIDPNASGGSIGAALSVAIVFFLVFAAASVVAPFLLQMLARFAGFIPGAANFVATRRVSTNPRETWRRVSAMTFLSFLLGVIVLMPQFDDIVIDGVVYHDYTQEDIPTGITITYAIGFVVMLVSTILTQASAVFEQCNLTRALDFIGVPVTMHRRVAFKQTFYPLFALSAFGFGIGALLGLALFASAAQPSVSGSRSLAILLMYLGSVVAAGLATLLVDPLRRKLLHAQVRRND